MSNGQDEPEPVNILIVADRADSRSALKAILAGDEYRLLEAASQQEALQHLRHHDCAVILLDVATSALDGFELAARIKQGDGMACMPIVFLTAEAVDEDLVRRAYTVGVADYLIKPLLPQMVRAKVGVFAELYQQRRRIASQAERLLDAERRESERRYRNLAESVPHVVWSARADGRVDYFNRRWFEYTGADRDQPADSWLTAVHPDDQCSCRVGWEVSLQAGEPFETVCRLRRPDGSYRWQLCRALPERGEDGTVIGWLGTFTDVDEQRRQQGALAELKSMLDVVLDAVVIFDPRTGLIEYANGGASRLFGCTVEELVTRRVEELVPALAEEDPLAMLQPLADHKAVLDTRCRRRGCEQVPVELSLQLVEEQGGRVILIARDISDRKQGEALREYLYQKALDAVQARDEFLSIASHELRTPLTSLSLQIEMLERQLRNDRSAGGLSVAELTQMLKRQVGRLNRLIDDLLDVSRLSGGQFRIVPQPVDLMAIARDAVAGFARDAESAGCEVRLRGDGNVRGVWDPLRLEQMLANLLANAIKFGAGEPVEIDIGRCDDAAYVIVRDHGVGIPLDAQARVFERFERASETGSYAGLGLGLYITRQIVEAHGGSIRVDSAPGKGATFTVVLPLAAADTTAPPLPEGSAKAAS